MAFTIAQVKADLTGMVHSTTIGKITNPNQVFERAARNLLAKIDPDDTIRTIQITNAVHDEIYDYSAPDDLKGKKIIDLRPQVNRSMADNFSQRGIKEFDLFKDTSSFSIRHNNGVKTLRLAASLSGAEELNECDSLTANGTWAAGGDATNLTVDTLNYLSGAGSLNFDLTGGATTGYLENSTITAVDLSDLEDVGSIFVRVFIPSTSQSNVASFTLNWGSSSSAYWSDTITSPHDQSTFKTGWQILRFDWDGATKTLSPSSSAIDYLKLTVTVTVATADTDFRVDKFGASSGEIWELEYYSDYLFKTSAGTWQQTTADDNDYVNLDTDALNIFEYECLLAISQQNQGEDAVFDRNFAKEQLYGDNTMTNPGLYSKYLEDHMSQAIPERKTYYRLGLYN